MKKSLGFTLVELMVALVIGLIITAGAIQVFVVTKRTFLEMDGLTARQESLRFLSDIISVDVRTASEVSANPENDGDIDYSTCQGGAFATDVEGRQVVRLGYNTASDAAGGREGEAYCGASKVQEVRYFSHPSTDDELSGIFSCYVCADGETSSLFLIQDRAYFEEISNLNLSSRALKFHLVFDAHEGFGFREGASLEARSFFFSAISRPFVIDELDQL